VAVIGVGVAPRSELAEEAGLAVDNGVLVDQHPATSAAGVYAAGDVANALHPRYGVRLRLEHQYTVENHGTAAARSMLGKEMVYDRTPYFFSDQYDLDIEYRGSVRQWDDVVFRGDPAGHEFVCFWLTGGRVMAAMNANRPEEGDALESLVSAQGAVDPARLPIPDTKLADLSCDSK
jgi:3-phenylpropionate/trans-cinnamate dioxygenase ferredoxin reductase subunit